MSKENLYTFYVDCGRSGGVEAVFIATQEQVDNIIGKEVYFGEILGKHSEIYFTIEPEDIELKSENVEVITVLKDLFGSTISGYNPLEYYEPHCEDCGEALEENELDNKDGLCNNCLEDEDA